ncbi:unnamed protein product [Callosobruchus maculatus]|uniref:IGFBP N-terminal domain-containing protein n=1 Tax=Callosobruchus maculatus TaxID=64391 RepID=A0A653CRD5_CALMS|nr:unnamed protein product [Callosobruchus maculatus]
MQRFFSLFLIVYAIEVAKGLVCTEDYCSTIRCKQEKCGPGQTSQPGTCGCCNVCVNVIHEGEPCDLLALTGPAPPRAVCDENLVCYENKCTKETEVIGKFAASDQS